MAARGPPPSFPGWSPPREAVAATQGYQHSGGGSFVSSCGGSSHGGAGAHGREAGRVGASAAGWAAAALEGLADRAGVRGAPGLGAAAADKTREPQGPLRGWCSLSGCLLQRGHGRGEKASGKRCGHQHCQRGRFDSPAPGRTPPSVCWSCKPVTFRLPHLKYFSVIEEPSCKDHATSVNSCTFLDTSFHATNLFQTLGLGFLP